VRPAAALAAARRAGAGRPAAALVLGSGFAAVLAQRPVRWRLPYGDLPGLAPCGVAGHRGELLGIDLGDGREAWAFSGRFHAYEGHAPEQVVAPVDLAAAAGARHMLLTCAAGGIAEGLAPGAMVIVEDHLNLSGWLPPLGAEPFLDMTGVYDPRGREALAAAASRRGRQPARGVLAAVRGPIYETPAEVRMLARLGADLVSMSTVPEAIRARALGLRVAAVACVANLAAGRGPERLSHGDVLDQVSRAAAADGPWLLAGLADWCAAP
jgi:purine-nucleoside phosphorylase